MARIEYVRARIRLPNGDRTVWAIEAKTSRPFTRRFWVMTKDGDHTEPREIIIATPADIVYCRPARMSRKYGWLELDTAANRAGDVEAAR